MIAIVFKAEGLHDSKNTARKITIHKSEDIGIVFERILTAGKIFSQKRVKAESK